jgi:DNA sulfur modification protein DndD
MKISRIVFKNYRCFKNAVFDFSKEGLNIVVGKNGSGKTELLYAIEWTFYGMDFSQLKGKTANPYSLNSDIYKNYINPTYDEVNEASVIIEFTHPIAKKVDGAEELVETKFWLKKSEIYNPNGKSTPNQSVHSQLSYFDENGNKMPPFEDEECQKKIKKIIPKKILSGLLFDGERMKALSNDDEDSRNTIDGFISEITNIEQLSFTKQIIETVKKEYSSNKSKLLKNQGFIDEAQENDNILKNEELIIRYEADRDKAKSLQADSENALKIVNNELKRYSEIKEAVAARNSAKSAKATLEKAYTKFLDNFESQLSQGYLLQCKGLFEQVNQLIDRNDVPTGLTVEAAKSILAMPRCICGEEWTEESRKRINDLINNLPPTNLNSAISQTIEAIEKDIEDEKLQLKSAYKDIREYNSQMVEFSKQISDADKLIGSSNVDAIKEKENQRSRYEQTIGECKAKINDLIGRIRDLKDENKKKRDELDKYSDSNKDIKLVSQKIAYVDKCIKIIKDYIELNKKESLDIINGLISEAYKQISEDYDEGKRIYITQFTEPKYKIVTYFKDKYKEIYSHANWVKLFAQYNISLSEIDDEEKKKEVAIIEAAENSSTGQRKIVTLSFVKAVMEYATAKNLENEFRSKKEYPLFIDAPFSELSGENLSKFAKELPNFNKQSIVMLDPNIYSDIKKYFEKNIAKEYEISKNSNSNDTTVMEVI